jgi:hypothetical protein
MDMREGGSTNESGLAPLGGPCMISRWGEREYVVPQDEVEGEEELETKEALVDFVVHRLAADVCSDLLDMMG